MILKYAQLSRKPKIFRSMTGVKLELFAEVVNDVKPRFVAAETKRFSRPDRQRAIGGGRNQVLSIQDQILLTIVWLRCYPKQAVLAYLFGISDASVSRILDRVLPLLEASGRDTMRLPDPGRKRRRSLDEVLKETPELAVIIDSFEQKVQRHQDRQASDAHYSGKKRQHTLKVQVAVEEEYGLFVDVSASVPGPTADLDLLKQSQLMERLSPKIGVIGDLAYLSIAQLHPTGQGATPRRKPRGKARPPADILYNQAFARRRIKVEHSIGFARRFESITQADRHHRRKHNARVVAVCGLANRRICKRHGLDNIG